MTTEPPGTPEPTPAPEPAPAPVPPTPPPTPTQTPTPTPTAPLVSNMSGETMVMIGAALVLASYVIFALIANEYHQFIVQLVAAGFAVILPSVDRDSVAKVAPFPVAMKVLGYVIAVGGLFEILFDIRFGVLTEFMVIAGALVAYAGYVLAFIGARSIKS